MVYSFALSQFLHAPFHFAAKTPPALSHRSYRCYIYVTPLGSVARNYRNVVCPPPLMALRTLRALNLGKNITCGIVCLWRSRIADRNNAPRSVSRVRSGLRDDCVGGLWQGITAMLFALLALNGLKNVKGVKLGWAKTCGNDHEIANSCLRNTPRWGLGCDLLYCKGNPPQKNHAKKHYWRLTKKI